MTPDQEDTSGDVRREYSDHFGLSKAETGNVAKLNSRILTRSANGYIWGEGSMDNLAMMAGSMASQRLEVSVWREAIREALSTSPAKSRG